MAEANEFILFGPILGLIFKKWDERPRRRETVSQFVIPAKPRETGREPGSRSPRDDAISLDTGSPYAARRSSGMTDFIHYDTLSQERGTYKEPFIPTLPGGVSRRRRVNSHQLFHIMQTLPLTGPWPVGA